MPETIFCPHCGTQNADDDLFCVSCGKKLSFPNTEVQSTPITNTQKQPKVTHGKKSGLNITILTVIIFMLVALVIYFASQRQHLLDTFVHEEDYQNSMTSTPDAEEIAALEQAAGETFVFEFVTASSKGYGGPVTVEVAFEVPNGIIASLSIGSDKFAESEGYGAKALEPEFIDQFIGLRAPVAMEEIDAISGATTTTEAVVNAINKAYSKLEE